MAQLLIHGRHMAKLLETLKTEHKQCSRHWAILKTSHRVQALQLLGGNEEVIRVAGAAAAWRW